MAHGERRMAPEELELQWFRKHYRGNMTQLSWRAVLMGACLGAVLSLTNIYVGLKTGWGFGVAITACVLSFAIWKGLRKIGIARSDMTVLENNAMQSTASSAGYSTGERWSRGSPRISSSRGTIFPTVSSPPGSSSSRSSASRSPSR